MNERDRKPLAGTGTARRIGVGPRVFVATAAFVAAATSCGTGEPTSIPADQTTNPSSTTSTEVPITELDPNEPNEPGPPSARWQVEDPLMESLNEYDEYVDDELNLIFYVTQAGPFEGHAADSYDDYVAAQTEPPTYEYEVRWLYGNADLDDPFSEGDLLLTAEFNPHDSDYNVTDFSGQDIEISGRTARIAPWVTNYDDDSSVGFEIFWDADPSYYVFARSRTFSESELVAILETVTLPAAGPRFDHKQFGVDPLPIDWKFWHFDEPIDVDFAGNRGFRVSYDVEGGSDPDADSSRQSFLLLEGSAADVVSWRFKAANETPVAVRGTQGYLLSGVDRENTTVLVWLENEDTVGLLVAETNGDDIAVDLAALANRIDPTVIPATE